jgi:hypothetical protein
MGLCGTAVDMTHWHGHGLHSSSCTLKLQPDPYTLQERDQQLADALYAAHGELGFSRDFFVKVRHS